MLKSATVATNNNNVKRVTFQSLGLDRAMHGNEAEMTIEQNSTNIARRSSIGVPSAKRAMSGRSAFSGPPDILIKEDVCLIYSEGLPELPGNRNLLKFSNNSYYQSTPTERFKIKSMSRNGRQTPLPQSGLQSHIEPMDLSMEAEEAGGSVIEEDEAENGHEDELLEQRHGLGLTDLGNAPPLVDVPYDEMNKLEVNGSGEKRKSTPPDLLALSQMYFERNQITLTVARENSAAAVVTSNGKLRKFNSADSSLVLPSDRIQPNLGIARPRKLTPLQNRPAMLDMSEAVKESGSAIGPSSTRQALHLPVKYSAKSSAKTRPNLDPIHAKEDGSPTKRSGSGLKKSSGRKETYVVKSTTSPTSTPEPVQFSNLSELTEEVQEVQV